MHANGSYSNEFEAALDLSRIERNLTPDAERITALLQRGRFVVVSKSAAYCHFTDAILGEVTHFCSDHDTRNHALTEASSMAEEDYDVRYVVLPIEPVVTSIIAYHDDIPF